MKRISWWPQLFLGLVFNWGAFMGWAAVREGIEFPAILLYVGGVYLTLGYDTIYALQDRVDDQHIGVRSSALALKDNIKLPVGIFYALALFCFWAAAGNVAMALGLIPAVLHCAWQVYSLDILSPACAKKIFFSNVWLGLLIALSLFISGL